MTYLYILIAPIPVLGAIVGALSALLAAISGRKKLGEPVPEDDDDNDVVEVPESYDQAEDSQRKYDDPDSQQAHEESQKRDIPEKFDVGTVHKGVVFEFDEKTSRIDAKVRLGGRLMTFVDDNVPKDISEGDTILLRITSHSKNAVHARFIEYAE